LAKSSGFPSSTKFEKPPGWDWVIFYLDGDDPDVQAMSVFGQMTPEKALEEARDSLSGNLDYEILGVFRRDKELPLG
jgi:hypothetical protein